MLKFYVAISKSFETNFLLLNISLENNCIVTIYRVYFIHYNYVSASHERSEHKSGRSECSSFGNRTREEN